MRLDRPAASASAVGPQPLDRAAARGEPDRRSSRRPRRETSTPSTAVVEAYLPRIAALSRRYRGAAHVERLELVQEGVAGLLQALERYDPARGTPFWAYARPTVQRAMQRLVAELGDAAVLSDHALRRLSRLKSAEDELMREHRRLPTRREIVERSGVDRDEAERLLAETSPPRSFQEPITAEDGGVIGSLGDLVDDPRAEDAYDRVLDVMEAHELMPLLSVLSPRERSILRARYGLDGEEQSIRQIAERLGLSTSRVRDIERRALRKLRRAAVDPRRGAVIGAPSRRLERLFGDPLGGPPDLLERVLLLRQVLAQRCGDVLPAHRLGVGDELLVDRDLVVLRLGGGGEDHVVDEVAARHDGRHSPGPLRCGDQRGGRTRAGPEAADPKRSDELVGREPAFGHQLHVK